MREARQREMLSGGGSPWNLRKLNRIPTNRKLEVATSYIEQRVKQYRTRKCWSIVHSLCLSHVYAPLCRKR